MLAGSACQQCRCSTLPCSLAHLLSSTVLGPAAMAQAARWERGGGSCHEQQQQAGMCSLRQQRGQAATQLPGSLRSAQG